MIKTIININDMVCGMCEAHINDAVRKNFAVKKVTSSKSRKMTEIVSDDPLDEQRVREIIITAGYTVTGISAETYEKKGFSLFKR